MIDGKKKSFILLICLFRQSIDIGINDYKRYQNIYLKWIIFKNIALMNLFNELNFVINIMVLFNLSFH